MEYIQLGKSDLLVVGIKDDKGNDTGNTLEFDLTDVTLSQRYQEMLDQHNKNVEWFAREKTVIEKRQDSKQKGKILSKNEEALSKVINEFYKKEMETYDIFLGEGGTEKLLNGRRPYVQMFFDIDGYIKQIIPLIEEKSKTITEQFKNLVKSKYKVSDEDVLEDED